MKAITARELLERIDAGRAPTILDVRSAQEYERGHVPGAILIPFWKFISGHPEIPAALHDPVVVYCGHGPRAYMAGSVLRARGFNCLIYLKGHMSGWAKAGLRRDVL